MTTIKKRQVEEGTLTRAKLGLDVFLRALSEIDNTDSPYTLLSTDEVILVDTSLGSVTIGLPALAGIPDGRVLLIKDSSGTSSINTIAVDPNGSETIEGNTAPLILSTDYTVLRLTKAPSDWVRGDSPGTFSSPTEGKVEWPPASLPTNMIDV